MFVKRLFFKQHVLMKMQQERMGKYSKIKQSNLDKKNGNQTYKTVSGARPSQAGYLEVE